LFGLSLHDFSLTDAAYCGKLMRIGTIAERFDDFTSLPEITFNPYLVKHKPEIVWRNRNDSVLKYNCEIIRKVVLDDINLCFPGKYTGIGYRLSDPEVSCLFDTKWPLHIAVYEERLNHPFYRWGFRKPLVLIKVDEWMS